MSKDKSDYFALQLAWQKSVYHYLDNWDIEIRYKAINDLITSLVDIKKDGPKAIYSNYMRWENEYWLPLCKKGLDEWINFNSFEAKLEENKKNELENIKRELNHLRYHEILQIIQNSGIGLGHSSDKQITSTVLRGKRKIIENNYG